jgi:hypothetical protein
MKKREIVWLVIKVIGLYFIYEAVTSGLKLIASFIVAFQAPELFYKSIGIFIPQIVLVALCAIIANYLLRDGRLVFDILNREEPSNFLKESVDEISIK